MCSCLPAVLASALVGEADNLALNTLLPGALVNTKVSQVMRDGLQVRGCRFVAEMIVDRGVGVWGMGVGRLWACDEPKSAR